MKIQKDTQRALGTLSLWRERIGERSSLNQSLRSRNLIRKDKRNPTSLGVGGCQTYARLCSALKDLEGDQAQVTEADLDLLGQCSYFDYYHQRAIQKLDPSVIAQYTHELASAATNAYHSEKVNGGREGFIFAMRHAEKTLKRCMLLLGMTPLSSV